MEEETKKASTTTNKFPYFKYHKYETLISGKENSVYTLSKIKVFEKRNSNLISKSNRREHLQRRKNFKSKKQYIPRTPEFPRMNKISPLSSPVSDSLDYQLDSIGDSCSSTFGSMIGLFNISFSDTEGSAPKKWTFSQNSNEVLNRVSKICSPKKINEEEEITLHLTKLNLQHEY